MSICYNQKNVFHLKHYAYETTVNKLLSNPIKANRPEKAEFGSQLLSSKYSINMSLIT